MLTLLVVGLTSTKFIADHPGTHSRKYNLADWSDLITFLESRGELVLNPHVLTETHHFLTKACHGDMLPAVVARFRALVQRTREMYSASRDAVARPEFGWLGLTDSVLLTIAERNAELLTDDGRLHYEASKAGYPSTNFTHIRELRT